MKTWTGQAISERRGLCASSADGILFGFGRRRGRVEKTSISISEPASGYSATPSITFTGSVAGFGTAVVNAGDLDGDGLADIAIASPSDGGGGKIYIFSRKNPPASWGTTTAWACVAVRTLRRTTCSRLMQPTLGELAWIQPRSMARLGNFDGTGSDDLAIGFAGHNSFNGSVLIISSAAFASETTDPSAANTIEIDGAVDEGVFGFETIGIGQFYASPAGPTMVAGAPGTSNVFAFAGCMPSGTIATTTAKVVHRTAVHDSASGSPVRWATHLVRCRSALRLWRRHLWTSI